MGLGRLIQNSSIERTLKKAQKGKNDFQLPYRSLIGPEGIANMHSRLIFSLGQAGLTGFLYMTRAYAREDSPLRVHISHRNGVLTSDPGGEPNPEFGASLRPALTSPNYVHKRLVPDGLGVDQYDPNEPTHRRSDRNDGED